MKTPRKRRSTEFRFLHTEFCVLLDRADLRPTDFARLTGVTQRGVSKWRNGETVVPLWAAGFAALAQTRPDRYEHLPAADKIARRTAETAFSWYESMGVAPDADKKALRAAWARMAAIYHPDKCSHRRAASAAAFRRIDTIWKSRPQ
jgi:transcriptional regulator with XRE-family HTH domain